jgi:hypothetical protein
MSVPAWYRLTLDGLKPGQPDRVQLEEFLEGNLDRLDLGDTYDDVLDRLDGYPWDVDGQEQRLELPDSTLDPVYKRIRSIAKQVRRELI